MKRTVFLLNITSSDLACLTTSLTSATPQVHADNFTNLASPFTFIAIILASVVFPHPGGPQSIKLGIVEEPNKFLSIVLGPSEEVCPK